MSDHGRRYLCLLVVSQVLWGSLSVREASAQPFTNINASLTGVRNCALAWADYDNDGDPDLAVAGMAADYTAVTRICRNDGSNGTGGWVFTDIQAGLTGVSYCSLCWADFDKDGDLDLAVAGETDPSAVDPVTKVYRNDGPGPSGGWIFTDIQAALQGVRNCSISWGDYDHDGDADLILAGLYDERKSPVTKLYRNDGSNGAGGWIFTDTGLPFLGVECCSLAWGDFDSDGDVDLVLAGTPEGSADVATRIYRNDGPGSGGWVFTDIGASLPGVMYCWVAWGDFDHDGDVDLALAGRNATLTAISKVYRNDGSNGSGGWVFTDVGAAIAGVHHCSLAWGHLDNDGDLDLAVAGTDGSSRSSRVYRHDGGGVFTNIAAALTGVDSGALAWGDYDRDGAPGDLDLALAGWTGSIATTRIYRNDGPCGATGPDADGDGVPDCTDQCSGTVPGAPVDTSGCPPLIRGDLNRDGDVDGEDLDAFESCASGPAIPYTGNCAMCDFDIDGDADQSDFAAFQRCYSGEDVPADATCAD